jgi:hypothetical protein
VLFMLVGGVLLVVGLVTPWYYRSERLTLSGYWSMSAFGGSLERANVQNFEIYPFNPLPAYLTLCFATVSILLSFISTKLPEKSQRKYVAIVSCLTGISALMTIVYIHSWLSMVFPETPFVCEDLIFLDCGPMIGYFLTWVATALLFASTYVSKGLTQMSVKAED